MLSRQAWHLLGNAFQRVLEDASDLEARANMQLGACLAGLAIENSMLGAAHALANPLTATYGTVHGQAVGVMLPHVIRFNAAREESTYRSLGINSAEALADRITQLVSVAGLETRLANLGVEESQFEALASQAAQQWTGRFNPRAVDQQNLCELYQLAW